MLHHGLQGFEGLSILIPNTKRLQPIRRYHSLRTCACRHTGSRLARMRARPRAWSLVHSRSRSASLLPAGRLLALRTGDRSGRGRRGLELLTFGGLAGEEEGLREPALSANLECAESLNQRPSGASGSDSLQSFSW